MGQKDGSVFERLVIQSFGPEFASLHSCNNVSNPSFSMCRVTELSWVKIGRSLGCADCQPSPKHRIQVQKRLPQRAETERQSVILNNLLQYLITSTKTHTRCMPILTHNNKHTNIFQTFPVTSLEKCVTNLNLLSASLTYDLLEHAKRMTHGEQCLGKRSRAPVKTAEGLLLQGTL